MSVSRSAGRRTGREAPSPPPLLHRTQRRYSSCIRYCSVVHTLNESERERKGNRIERRDRSEAYSRKRNESAYMPTPPRGTLNAAASSFLVVSLSLVWSTVRRIPGISAWYIVTRRVRASSVILQRVGGSFLPSGFSFLARIFSFFCFLLFLSHMSDSLSVSVTSPSPPAPLVRPLS